jgi:hypothetical protein
MAGVKSDTTTRRTGRHKGAPTISDVARLAECSPMTVSRVINGERSVREATRQAVLEAIGELNYKPNRAARRLAGTDQARIALLYSNPSASYLSELLMGGLEQASLSDVHLVVERCEFEKDEFAVVNRLAESGIEGFLLPSPLCDEQPLLDCLSELGVSAVAIGAGVADAGLGALGQLEVDAVARYQVAAGLGDADDRFAAAQFLRRQAEVHEPLEVQRGLVPPLGVVEPVARAQPGCRLLRHSITPCCGRCAWRASARRRTRGGSARSRA